MSAESRPGSGAVTAAAIVAILGSILVLLGAALALVGVFAAQNFGGARVSPAEVRQGALAGVGFILAFGVWGLVSGFGLLGYRNWARISTLIWSGITVPFCLLVAVVILVIKLPTGAQDPDAANFARIVASLLYLSPAGIAVWWLILFTRKSIASLFLIPAGQLDGTEAISADAINANAIGAPAIEKKPKCPVPIAVVAWILVVSCALSTLFLLRHPPASPLFGHVLRGEAASFFFLSSLVITMAAGIGLLKLKPWAFWLMFGWQLFALFNGTITLLSPNYDSLMREVIQASGYGNAPPLPMQYYRLISTFTLVLLSAVPVILLVYRSRFFAAAAPSAPQPRTLSPV